MHETVPRVVVIPAKPELVQSQTVRRQLRVAAYCRVSTDDEEQLTSYEAQQHYYTDKIMTNHEWTMAGIFADEGITGTSARKRPEFLKMIRQCRQKKIDVILTKSISRFARNTVDCLHYIRLLKELGIAVIFEKENINTLESDSEILITLLGAFAQSESESISANVRWGKRQAMREGKVSIQYEKLYGFQRGEDRKPEIIPEQAKVVAEIYRRYLAGASYRMIQDWLREEQIPNKSGKLEWSIHGIRNILTNEKYCGDVLCQKTFTQDCISKKVVRNTGQLPMYLIQNHHEGIVDRKTFDAVQTEMARRNAGKSPSKKTAPTGRTTYTSKYSLSERLVCGECGTLYRRCTWTNRGKKRVVWRCVSRLDYRRIVVWHHTHDTDICSYELLSSLCELQRIRYEHGEISRKFYRAFVTAAFRIRSYVDTGKVDFSIVKDTKYYKPGKEYQELVDSILKASGLTEGSQYKLATVYKGNIIKNLIMDCQSYTKYRPNETTGGIFVSWRRKEELPTGA